MRPVANPAHSLLLSLSSGYILFYFSELVFWARPQAGDYLADWAVTWLAYSRMGFLFLALPTNWLVYLVVTPAGFARLGGSLWKIWRSEPAAAQPMSTVPTEIPPQTG